MFDWLFKKKHKHDWAMVSSKWQDAQGINFKYTRWVEFQCKECGECASFHRWAFEPSAGALWYFFGREWYCMHKDFDNIKV